MYGYRNFEVEVFEDTISKYKTTYVNETTELRNNNTEIYDVVRDIDFTPNPHMTVRVENDGTVSAGSKSAIRGRKTAILNFADGIEPGGLVLVGETTQEENICRCSNLYASLTTEKAYNEYYKVNAKAVSGVYTDRIIYSKDVTFFKDDVTYADVSPYKMDVITCPAPSTKITNRDTEYSVIYSRLENIIKSAVINNVDTLILGAWGCGAFGQDPILICRCFNELLKKYNAFNEVIFAVRSCRADSYKKHSNYDIFKERITQW